VALDLSAADYWIIRFSRMMTTAFRCCHLIETAG